MLTISPTIYKIPIIYYYILNYRIQPITFGGSPIFTPDSLAIHTKPIVK